MKCYQMRHKFILLGVFLLILLYLVQLDVINKILSWDNGVRSNATVVIPKYHYQSDIEWMDEIETKYAKMNEHIKTVCQRYNTTGKTHVYRRRWLIDTTHNLAHCLRAKLGSTGWIHNFNSLLAKAEREEKRALIVGKYMQWFHINKRKRKPRQRFLQTYWSMTVFSLLHLLVIHSSDRSLFSIETLWRSLDTVKCLFPPFWIVS